MKQPGSNSIMALWYKFRLARLLNRHKKVRGYRLYQGSKFLKMYTNHADAMKAKAHAEAESQSGAGHGCRPKPIENYCCVYARQIANGQWTFDAIVTCKQRRHFLGTHRNQDAAAKLVATFTHRSRKDLKAAKASMDPSGSMTRFRALAAVFQGWVPADIASAVQMRGEREAECMVGLAPGIFVGALLGKEDRWRRCVLDVWTRLPECQRLQMVGFETTNQTKQNEAASVMYHVFRDSLVAYAETARDGEREFWSLHVNRNVQHHHSLIPWAINYNLLKKQVKCANPVLCNQAHRFRLVDFNAKVHAAPMLKLHRLGRSTQCNKIPATCAEWLSEFTAASARANQFKLSNKGYHWHWLVRTRLLVEMRNAGIDCLCVSADLDSNQVVQAMLPDQSHWLQLWMKSTNNSLKKLMKVLDFKEPLEMLSCFACVLGDTSLNNASIDQITKSCTRIREARKTMVSSWGFEGNPALIVQAVIGGSWK